MLVRPLFVILSLAACSALNIEDTCGRARDVEAQGLISRPQYLDSIVRIRVMDSEGAQFTFDNLTWAIPVSTQGDSITAIHLHDRTDDELVYPFPDYDPGPGFGLNGTTNYSYPTPFSTLFALMRAGNIYLDVHTASQPEGTARADLTSVQFNDWASYSCRT